MEPAGTPALRRRDTPAVLALTLGGAALCVAVAVGAATSDSPGRRLLPLALVALTGVVAWCALERRTERALIVFALYIGLLDGYLKLRTGSRGVTLVRDLMLWAIALGVLARASRTPSRLPLPPMSVFVLGYALVVLVELANPSAPGLVQGLGGVRQHLEFVPLFFLGFGVVRTPQALKAALGVLLLVAALNGIVSYVQSTLTPGQLAGWGSGYRERVLGTGDYSGQARIGFEVMNGRLVATRVRPFGLGSELGAGGVTAVLALPALLALLLSGPGWWRRLAVVCAPGVALAAITSGSRGSLLACFVSGIAFVVLAGNSRATPRVLVAAIIGALVIAVGATQLGGHNAAARRASKALSANVLNSFRHERGASVLKLGGYLVRFPLGVGVGTIGPAAQAIGHAPSTLNSETEWNAAVIETGIPGLLLVLTLFGWVLRTAYRRVRLVSDPDTRQWLAALAAPLLPLFLLGFSGPVTITAPQAPYLWAVAGMLSYWLVALPRSSSPSAAVTRAAAVGHDTRSS